MDIRKILKDLLGLDSLPKGEELAGFTDEQLSAAIGQLREIASYNRTLKNVDDLRAAVEAFEAVTAAVEKRKTDAAKLEKDIEELSSRVTVTDDDADKEDDKDADDKGDGDKTDEVVVETPAPAAVAASELGVEKGVKVEAVAEPVAAAATPAPAPVPDPTTAPPATPDLAPITLVAAGDVSGYSTGQNMEVRDVAQAMTDKADAMHLGGGNGRLSVGRMKWEYPAERTLGKDADENTRKITQVVAAAQDQTREVLDRIMWTKDPHELETLTAAGGLCAPVNVRYELFTVGTTARPLRDSLTRFGANRGGIRFNAPPTLADLAAGDAVNIYTEGDDAESTGYPKGCIRVECGDDVEVTVSAITLCMEVGNYVKLFNPENPNAWWGLGRVQHARIAEDAIWDRLDALSTNVTAGEGLGATPDTLAQVERAAAQYRDRHRIDPETPLRLRAPTFLRNIMRVDLARRAPGDSTLSVSNGEIARYFAARNIAVTWALDGQIAGGTSGYPQAAGALNPWPSTVDVNLSIDGTFLFLDGGSLDFGTEIRDFDHIRANDSGMFMEVFENTAFVGPEAIHLTLNLCPDGTTSGEDADAISCVVGS